MGPGWDGDVKLHEDEYWSVSLRAGVGGSGDGGVGVDMDGTDIVSSSGSVDGAVGDGCDDNGRNVVGSWLCGGGV